MNETTCPSTRRNAWLRGALLFLPIALFVACSLTHPAGTGEAEYGKVVALAPRPVPLGPLRIAVLGDTHSTIGVHVQVIADVLADQPHLVLHTGDLALRAIEGEKDFFRVEGALLRSVPFLPARGNHDDDAARFVQLFVKPQGGTEPYYTVRWGPIAVVVVDTNQPVSEGSPQYRWLARTLEDLARVDDVTFRFVVMHWGPFDSGSGHGANMNVRTALVPLFERSGVDVVFSGHDHTYERSTVRSIRYVVTGGGGGGGGKQGRKRHDVLGSSWTEASASVPHHCLLQIDGRTLQLTAREAGTGRILDEFRVDKSLAPPAHPPAAARAGAE